MKITEKTFGFLENGEKVSLYSLKNETMEVEIISYGGIIKKILFPDKDGNLENLVLSFETIEEYEKNRGYFGCITGRVAGRIKEGILKLKEDRYFLEKNNKGNHMHGGNNSLNRKNWKGETIIEEENISLILKYQSPHLENGYPGKVDFTVKYTLNKSCLTIDYEGNVDRETYLSLTNHTFFNLSGDFKRDIKSHTLKIASNSLLRIDENNLPLEIMELENSPFDFTGEKKLETVLSQNHIQLINAGGGLDHAYILEELGIPQISLKEEISGRIIEVFTDQPSVVIYSGNYLNGLNYYREKNRFKNHFGICLETQDYPDVFNTLPKRGKLCSPEIPYKQKTKFTFKNI